ncbi:MAG: FixH family protein, partial [Solirubrobacterales bacterium]|nr:FixH family protein [Solirubrobacterales bacterium]
APPPPASALAATAVARVGPGPVNTTLRSHGYALALGLSPNSASVRDKFSVGISRGGAPVRGASVTVTLTMAQMTTAQSEYQLSERRPGTYVNSTDALSMAGSWLLDFEIKPPGAAAFSVPVLDRTR